MANTKISSLTAVSGNGAVTDEFIVADGTSVSKKTTLQKIVDFILTRANTFSGDNDIKDTLEIYDPSDTTKKVRLDAGSVSTATTRVVSVPDRDLTLCDGPTLATPQASTSGTSIDFTGIPSWVKKITICFIGVSTSGTSNILIQLGDSGGVEATGYLGAGVILGGGVVDQANYTAGFGFPAANAANIVHGSLTLCLANSSNNTWVVSGNLALSNTAYVLAVAGSKATSAALDRVRITTVAGTDTFDAGTLNIIYE